MAIDKVKLPDNSVEEVRDSRIPGIDSAPTSGSGNLVTSGGVKSALDGYLPLTGGTMSNSNVVTNLNADYLDGRNGSWYAWYNEETNVNNVDYNKISYDKNCTILVQPIHVNNYTGQTNYPFTGYGQMLTFGGHNSQFPFRIAHSNNNNQLWYQAAGYITTSTFDFSANKEWKRIAFADELGGYLPLTGGAMTGNIFLTSESSSIYLTGSDSAIVTGTSSATGTTGYSIIGQAMGDTYLRGINDPVYRKYKSNWTYQEYTMWHAGNDGASSGLDADLLDGKHASDFLTSHQTLYEANLVWGGRNLVADFGPLDAAMIGALGANRGAFLNPSGVTVEYSRDAGSTWSDYGADDNSKRALFSGVGDVFRIGKGEGGDTTNYQLRISLHSSAAGIYTILNKFAILISTAGSLGCHVQIRARTQNNYENSIEQWDVFADSDVSGWSGWNIINTQGIITYGNSPSYQYGEIQFIFTNTGYDGGGTYWGLAVLQIMMFGGVGWETPSTMASKGTLYDWDANQNATFPAAVTANSLVSNGTVTGTGISPNWSDRWDSGGRYRPWYGLDIPQDTNGVALSGYYGIRIHTGSNDIFIGGGGNYNNNIGIGTDTPTRKLSVAGGIGAMGEESMFSNSTFTDPAVGIACGIKVSGGLASTGDTYLSTLSGNVGIGTTSPASKLTVAGTIRSENQSDGSPSFRTDGANSYTAFASFLGGSRKWQMDTINDGSMRLYLDSAGKYLLNMWPSGTVEIDGGITTTLQTSEPSGGMLPNREYQLGTLSGNTTFTLASGTSGVTNHYFWSFDTGSTAPTITWPSAITSWYGGSAPTISASKHYEVSVLDGVAICMEV